MYLCESEVFVPSFDIYSILMPHSKTLLPYARLILKVPFDSREGV